MIKGFDMWEEAEKSGIADPTEMKAQQDGIHVYKYPTVGNEKEPHPAQWWQWLHKKRWAKTEIMEIQFKHKKTPFTVR